MLSKQMLGLRPKLFILLVGFVLAATPLFQSSAGYFQNCTEKIHQIRSAPYLPGLEAHLNDVRIVSDYSEVEAVAEIAYAAFADDPLFVFMAKQVGPRKILLRSLIVQTFLRGKILVNSEGPIRSFALWIEPEEAGGNLFEMFLSGQLQLIPKFGLIHSIKLLKLSHYLNEVRREHCKNDCIYLFLIGVDPANQRQGLGHNLIAPVLTYAAAHEKKVILEIQKDANQAYYESFGFRVVAEKAVPSSEGPVSKTLLWLSPKP